jgi:hypothetical protein
VFNIRCRHDNITPNSIKLNTTVGGNKAKTILKKAEKALLRERIFHCAFTIKKLEIERDRMEVEFYNILDPEVVTRTRTFLMEVRKRESDKCKARQIKKFENLKVKSGGNPLNNVGENIKDRWVINASSRTLSDSEQHVLTRGLKFAVTPSKLPINELITSTEDACFNLCVVK